MMLIAVIFSFGVAYIAYRGVNGSTSVNIAINVIQITALLIFSVAALMYRADHPAGSHARQFDPQTSASFDYEFGTTTTLANGVLPRTNFPDAHAVRQPT